MICFLNVLISSSLVLRPHALCTDRSQSLIQAPMVQSHAKIQRPDQLGHSAWYVDSINDMTNAKSKQVSIRNKKRETEWNSFV